MSARRGAALAPVLLALLAFAAASADASLVRLTFDPGEFSWSDSLTVFQGAKGGVRVTNLVAASAPHSLELQDVPADGDFPELLAGFRELRSGVLIVSFALLPTARSEEWNVALAGRGHFGLRPDGFAVWLQARDGVLRHVSDAIPKRLADLEPQRWHYFEIRLDVGRGRYALEVRREGEREPLVRVAEAWNATATPGSAVDRLSFVGDPGADRSAVRFFLDDVEVRLEGERAVTTRPGPAPPPGSPAAGGAAAPAPAPAPHGGSSGTLTAAPSAPPVCPPAYAPEDLGLSHQELASIRRAGVFQVLEHRLLGMPGGDLPAGLAADPALRSFADWVDGCLALARGDLAAARRGFTAALETRPSSWLAQLALALVEARAGNWDAVNALLVEAGAGERFRDARYAVVLAEAARLARDFGAAHGALPSAEAFLAREPSPGLADFLRLEPGRLALEGLRLRHPAEFRRLLDEVWTAEQLYFVLRDEDLAAALRFATGMEARLSGAGLPAVRWIERSGDVQLARGNARRAEARYRAALEAGADPAVLWGKIAAAAERRGDAAAATAARANALAASGRRRK